MNAEKLKRLQSQVRIGGKGTARRKKKVMHQTATTDDKKLQSSLKKLSVSTIPGIEEVNIIKDDLTVIHFNNPKAQASLSANTFAVTGHGETKKIVEMLPEILPQLGQETVVQLRMFANSMTGAKKTGGAAGDAVDAAASANMLYSVVEEDDVPMLVSDFDEVAKMEAEKLGPTAIATTITEQPASEFDPNKNAIENKEETAAVLPVTTSKETSDAEMNDVKKRNEIQPLDTSNLNIKLAEDSKSQIIDAKESKKQGKNVKKDNLNKIEKSNEKSAKDFGKANEGQKKQEKTPQKQEGGKQKTKSEGNNQKGSKENIKPDESVNQTVEEEKKTEKYPKTTVVNESAKPPQVTEQQPTQNQQKQPQTQKGVKSDPSQGKQQKNEKQTEIVTDKQQKKGKQPDQQKKAKQDQKQRQTDLKEYADKQQKLEKCEVNSPQTKTIAEPQGQDKQQEKIPTKPEQPQEKQKEQKQAQALKSTQQQQQTKGEQQNKQKNKQGPQKSLNQDNQKKSEYAPQLKTAELVKQEEKQAAPQLKSSEERSATNIIEIEQSGTEEQKDDTKQSLKKLFSKEAPTAQPGTIATVDEQKQKVNLEQSKPVEDVPKVESPTVKGRDIKNNMPLTEIGATTKPTQSVADISIKSVALQSLESTEKMLQMVNEMTKTLPLDGPKTEKNESEKEVNIAALPVENPKETVSNQIIKSNLFEVNTVVPPVEPELNIIAKREDQNLSSKIVEIVKDNKIAESPNQGDAKLNIATSVDKGTNEAKMITGSVLNAEEIQQEVGESREKINVVDPQPVVCPLAAPLNVPSGVKLPKQPTLAEVVQTQPSPVVSAIVPNLAINAQIVESTPKKDISVSTELSTKQPTIAEVLHSQSPQIPAVTGEIKDKLITGTLLKEDVRDDKLPSTATPVIEGQSSTIDESKTAEGKADSPQLPTPTEDKTTLKSIDETLPVSPKQKMSPPKQTANIKTTQEISKLQTKPLLASEHAKTPSDTNLKLVTKTQSGQQHPQQQQQKSKPKPMNNNKSTPTTPTTPTKASPEKSAPSPKSTTPNPKPACDLAPKKANSPQKQQQTDGASKSKPAQGAVGKARPGTSNAASAPVGVKKANTPPSANKISPSTGGKQHDAAPKVTPANTTPAPAQSKANATPPISAPATENTAEQPADSK